MFHFERPKPDDFLQNPIYSKKTFLKTGKMSVIQSLWITHLGVNFVY